MNPYQATKTTSPHWREEEQQWLRLVSSGDPVKGMVLIFLQKMCTAFHEFEPAWQAKALNADKAQFFREHLTQRVLRVLEVMNNNGLTNLKGYAKLADILKKAETIRTTSGLVSLVEDVHDISHLICDELEKL